MKPDWLPDWRKEKSYHYLDPKTTIARQWAWEFLRRNPEYQKDCERLHPEFFSRLREKTIKMTKLTKEDFKSFLKSADSLSMIDLTEKFITVEFEYIQDDEILMEYFLGDSYQKLLDKYGLSFMDHPRENPSLAVFSAEYIPYELNFDIGAIFDPYTMQLKDNILDIPFIRGSKWEVDLSFKNRKKISIEIDLTSPIKDQLRSIESRLEHYQRTINDWLAQGKSLAERERDKELYLSYLRVLDGTSAGAKTREMASRILPNISNEDPDYSGSKNIRNYRDAAIILRDSKYFSLSTFDM